MAEESTAALVRGSLPADGEVLSSDAFRGLEIAFENAQEQHATDVKTAAATQRRERVEALIDQHIDDIKWRTLLHQARQVAERGKQEYLLLRFPSSYARTVRARSTEASWVPLGGARTRLSGWQGDVGLFLFWGE